MKMNFFEFILQDWQANKGNTKGRTILLLFRIANFCTKRKLFYYIGLPYLLLYKLVVEWLLGVGIPWDTRIGHSLILFHGQGLVIHKDTVIGDHCTLRHCTTLGNKQLNGLAHSGSPVIGKHTDIGSNACIIGGINIGEHVLVGCGAVVVKDVSPWSTVTGNPGVERLRTRPDQTGK